MSTTRFNEWIMEATQLASWKKFLEPVKNDKKKFKSGGEMRIMTDKIFSSQTGIVKLVEKLENEDFLNRLMDSKSSIVELLEEDPTFTKMEVGNPFLNRLANAISNTVDCAVKKSRPGNPIIGVQSKTKADIFAESMSENLDKVRNEGFTSTRSIAQRFNELGIKSARGFDWSQTTVSQLINRRKKLSLEDDKTGLDMD